VTTRVNYVNRTAGCIPIAAVWETSEISSEGQEEALWFLKNRTYRDSATGVAHDKEAAIPRQAKHNRERGIPL
jgi:hypothetical protein